MLKRIKPLSWCAGKQALRKVSAPFQDKDQRPQRYAMSYCIEAMQEARDTNISVAGAPADRVPWPTIREASWSQRSRTGSLPPQTRWSDPPLT